MTGRSHPRSIIHHDICSAHTPQYILILALPPLKVCPRSASDIVRFRAAPHPGTRVYWLRLPWGRSLGSRIGHTTSRCETTLFYRCSLKSKVTFVSRNCTLEAIAFAPRSPEQATKKQRCRFPGDAGLEHDRWLLGALFPVCPLRRAHSFLAIRPFFAPSHPAGLRLTTS